MQRYEQRTQVSPGRLSDEAFAVWVAVAMIFVLSAVAGSWFVGFGPSRRAAGAVGHASIAGTPSSRSLPARSGSVALRRGRRSERQATAAEPGAAARCDEVDGRMSELVESVRTAMAGYPGDWGFALYDVECDALAEFPAGHLQYPASAGKVVGMIAALRAVEAGLIPFEEIADDLSLIFTISSDDSTDAIMALLDDGQVGEVLTVAGVPPQRHMGVDWRQAAMTPGDLARVWAALLRGDLLSPDSASLLLFLAAQAEIPEGLDTFPAAVDIEGLEYAQKAGYWVSEYEPAALVGAGVLRPVDGSGGFAMALMVRAWLDDPLEDQRRAVFPILLDFVMQEFGGL